MCAPFSRWLCKNDTSILSWFGQKKALRPVGESVYYLAPKCLYKGEYKWIQLRVLSPSWLRECMNGVLRMLFLYLVLSPASPFIVPRGGLGYRV